MNWIEWRWWEWNWMEVNGMEFNGSERKGMEFNKSIALFTLVTSSSIYLPSEWTSSIYPNRIRITSAWMLPACAVSNPLFKRAAKTCQSLSSRNRDLISYTMLPSLFHLAAPSPPPSLPSRLTPLLLPASRSPLIWEGWVSLSSC